MSRPLVVPLICLLLACQTDTLPDADLVLTNATVIDVESGELRSDQSIFIEGRRIVLVAPSTRGLLPAGAQHVDATGLFVIPGLWDIHVHSAASVSWHFPLLVAHGITGVRNMHSTVDTALGLTNAIKHRLSSGELLGPRFVANGPLIDGDPPTWPGSVLARNEDEGRRAVDSLVDGGADFIKVYDNLSREAYLGIADQARLRGIPVDGHMPFQVRPGEAAAAGQRTVEHTSGITLGCSSKADSLRQEHLRYLEVAPTLSFPDGMIAFFTLIRAALDTRDPAACATTARAYRENDVAVVPTLVVGDPGAALNDSVRMELLPAAVREEWEAMAAEGDPLESILGPVYPTVVANVRLLHAEGVPILAGTDLGNAFLIPGLSLHDELALLVEQAGLTPLEALRAATLQPARVLGSADSLGSVAEGMLADLVLLRGNPLEDIGHTKAVAGVVLNGRYLDGRALDGLLAEARRTPLQ